MQKQTKYTLVALEAVMEKMRNAPAPKKSETQYSKAESVKLMVKEIQSMQKRGYTMKMISYFLHENDIEIKEGVLKSYIQRGKAPAAAKEAKQSTKTRTKTDSTATPQKASVGSTPTAKSNDIEDVE